MDFDDLISLIRALALLALLLVAYSAGVRVRQAMPRHHDTPEMMGVLRAMNGTLVTFTALVLGLMVTSAKTSFDAAGADLARYGIQIVKVDHLLRQYGTDADPIRTAMRQYTEATLDQFRHGTPFDNAGSRFLDNVEDGIRRLRPADDLHRRLQSDSLNRMAELIQRRWQLVADRDLGMTLALYAVLVFWVTAAFFTFGLTATPNTFLILGMLVCGMAVASAMFVILDMETPFSGLISVSDRPLVNALTFLEALRPE